MEYSKEIKEYLYGDKFNNGAVIALNDNGLNTINRDEYLVELARDKNILHLGFVDHLPLLDEKIKSNNWLHKKLMDVSNICFGVDVNKEGIKYIQSKYEYKNLYCMDVLTDELPKTMVDIKFDYIMIPDVIEHIGNPVIFLEVIREKFSQTTRNIIVTTPNGFRLNNVLNVFRNREVINTDHRFWFTPYTLSKILIDAGYDINILGYFEHGKHFKRHFVRNILLSKFCALRDTLIIEASLK